MKVDCIVSCLVVLEVDTLDSSSDGTIEALAKHEFFCRLPGLIPDSLSVEILDRDRADGLL